MTRERLRLAQEPQERNMNEGIAAMSVGVDSSLPRHDSRSRHDVTGSIGASKNPPS